MSGVLKTILSLSVSGSLLIGILFLCGPLIKGWLGGQWRYYVWLIVVARLLLPVAPETNLVGSFFHADGSASVSARTGVAERSAGENGAFETDDETGREEGYKERPPAPSAAVSPATIAGAVWLLGALTALTRKITVYQSFCRFVKAGRTPVSDPELLDRLAVAERRTGVERAADLCVNPLISSPLLIGFFRPCIVLPSAEIPRRNFYYTMLHELTHYRRRDMFYKWLVQVTVCIHWFNPLAYLMEREIGRACEFSCDEAVIAGLPPQDVRDYGITLLDAMKAAGRYRESPGGVTLGENKTVLKERLSAMMKYRKKSKWAAVASLAAVMLFACGAYAAGAYLPRAGGGADSDGGVLYENGTYYVFCDGADESDRPSSSVTDGGIGIVIVRPDGYSSYGPYQDTGRLADEVKEQCEYLLGKNAITRGDAALLIETARQNRPENKAELKTETSRDAEYAAWGVEKRGDAYYYQNERVQILMDLRADRSFVTFYQDSGAANRKIVQLVRNENGAIIKARIPAQEEIGEILDGLSLSSLPPIPQTEEQSRPSEEKRPEDISRLTPEDAPAQIRDAVRSCSAGSWYVLEWSGRRYVYFDGLPRNYAYQFDSERNNLTVVDIGKTTGHPVLLSIPAGPDLTILYNGQRVGYMTETLS